jgi:hypothetical protein
MVDLYPAENLNAWNLLSVRHFFYKLLFTCTCLVLEISLFGSIAVNIVVIVFHIWHSDPYKDRLRPSRESTWGVMADKKQFSNTKLFVKVETGIVTHISYHHYLKNVGNNKWWPHMQKESWNIHGTKILICSITLNGTESQPSPSTSGLRVTLSYLRVRIAQS